ncbi:MAG: hypothetical protein EPN86_03570 [Nanoarchaeota archaeon]|nr:MAG: hypothetical protein EPN86_03570 [Nanoarchaeota archaeon]
MSRDSFDRALARYSAILDADQERSVEVALRFAQRAVGPPQLAHYCRLERKLSEISSERDMEMAGGAFTDIEHHYLSVDGDVHVFVTRETVQNIDRRKDLTTYLASIRRSLEVSQTIPVPLCPPMLDISFRLSAAEYSLLSRQAEAVVKISRDSVFYNSAGREGPPDLQVSFDDVETLGYMVVEAERFVALPTTHAIYMKDIYSGFIQRPAGSGFSSDLFRQFGITQDFARGMNAESLGILMLMGLPRKGLLDRTYAELQLNPQPLAYE